MSVHARLFTTVTMVDDCTFFQDTCLKEFSFLQREFGCEVFPMQKKRISAFITFKNQTTAIQISLEPLSTGIFVTFFKLKEGIVPEQPMMFNPEHELLVFDFGNVLIIKEVPQIKQIPALLFDQSHMERVLHEYAERVKVYGANLLRGDFSLLPQVKEIIAQRVKKL